MRAVGAIGGACLLTSLTTAIGFGSLALARMPILQEFGLFAALGVGFAYGSVLLVIPLLLSLTRGTVPDQGDPEAMTSTSRFLAASARLSTERPWVVLTVAATLIAVFAFLGTRVVIDNNLTRLLHADHPTTCSWPLTTNIAQKHATGLFNEWFR